MPTPTSPHSLVLLGCLLVPGRAGHDAARAVGTGPGNRCVIEVRSCEHPRWPGPLCARACGGLTCALV